MTISLWLWSNLLFLFPTSIDELEDFEKSINKLIDFKNDEERIRELLKPAKNAIRMNDNIAFQYYSNTFKYGVETARPTAVKLKNKKERQMKYVQDPV